jgi:hypothetical protein
MDYQTIFGIFSVAAGLVGFGLYFWSIYKGYTKPHAFTWVSFALLDAITFAAQVTSGAGAGSWALGLGAVGCTIVAVVAIFVGHVKIRGADTVSFLAALLGIVLWALTSNPLYAVILAAIINILGVIPTVRKSFDEPATESVTIWSIDLLRYGASLLALQTFTLTTALVPASILLSNAAVITTVLMRRHKSV